MFNNTVFSKTAYNFEQLVVQPSYSVGKIVAVFITSRI